MSDVDGPAPGNKGTRKTKRATKQKRSDNPSKRKVVPTTSAVLTTREDIIPIPDLNHATSNQPEAKTCKEFGISCCTCCNQRKHDTSTDPQSSYNKIIEEMPEDRRKELIKNEEQLLIAQQRELLEHPDFDSDTSEENAVIPPEELSQEKQELIEKFMNSMAADRIDYEKPKQLNIVNGLPHKRASNVVFKPELTIPAVPYDAKTILQRIDFEKENSEMEFICNTSIFPMPEINATSTPLSSSMRKKVEENYSDEMNLKVSDGSSIPEIDPIFVDCSNITLRTPQFKQKDNNNTNEASTSNAVTDLYHAREFCTSAVVVDNENISQDVHERILKHREATRSLLNSALDQLFIYGDYAGADSDDTLDCSVIAIGDTPPSGDVQCNINEEPIEITESDPEAVSIIEISDIETPSTSTRRRRKRDQPHNQLSKPPKRKRKDKDVIKVDLQNDEPEQNPANQGKALLDCPICMESLASKEISSTVCGHVYCTQCIKAVVKSRKPCPTCRTALTLKKIHPLFI